MKSIKEFYKKKGWRKKHKISKDAELFEDLRDCAQKYITNCRLRVLNHLPPNGGKYILDFASGPLQYDEYLEYSNNFKKRYCVDFSKSAIDQAKNKLGNKGKYYVKDFLDIKFNNNYFDSIISLHTIYHIDERLQRKVVLKLIDIAKKNAPIVIVYSNPDTLISKVKKLFFFKNKKKFIYFYCHPNDWWKQFENLAYIKFFPWRSFSSQHQKILFPDNFIGEVLFEIMFKLENFFPNFFVRFFQYQIIVLKKKK